MFLSQKVRKGREADYRRWQDEMTELARGFHGFEGKEVYPPGQGADGEWVVVFRFARIDQLTAWLNSPQHERMLARGRSLLEGPEVKEVLAGEPPVQPAVTVVISHHLAPGQEPAFVRWQQKVRKVQERYPGFLGFELFRPVPGVQEDWVSVFRFDTREHLDTWLTSEARKKLLDEGRAAFASYDVRQVGSAFGGWFRLGGDAAGHALPPNWKQAMAVLLGLYPIMMVLSLTTDRALGAAGVPGYLHLFIGGALSVCVLTWLVMPLVNRALRRWLTPGRETSARTHLLGALAVALGYAVMLAFFGWATGRL
ncbi:antibiotic biosynthesis monooxygenase [Sphaerisporangium melleum]|uniref:antibiotic biosynthesis monooxygenase n=1 Tax=Sphaerisporangium melleum TaxID=321316 RepID=UPI00194F4B0D|nr:antibiotic biosynthesis monooxygenase [Sphaerisporangium melleum]